MTPRRLRSRSVGCGAQASLVGLLADFVVPLVAYYVLRAAGASIWVALVVPSVLTGLLALARWIQRRRIDVLGLVRVGGADRQRRELVPLGQPALPPGEGAVFTAAIGVVLLGSLLLRRPFGFTFARDLIERTTIPTADCDEVWEREPRFRRTWRVIAVAWGVATLLGAVVLVFMAYRLPVDSVPALASALRIVTFVVLQVITNGYLMYAGGVALDRPRPADDVPAWRRHRCRLRGPRSARARNRAPVAMMGRAVDAA